MAQREHFAWVEKYRPQTLDECILPDAVKQSFVGMLTKKDTPNLLLTGGAGVGKTTVAKALCHMLDVDVLVINASDESGIDTVRTTIKDFASSMTLDGRRKYVILDEADMMTFTAQPALRALTEEFSRQCGFIFTANYPARIIPALHSRCSLVDFTIPLKERATLAIAFAKRAIDILTKEGVTFNQQVALGAVQMYFPDFRRTLNELQRFSATGTLSEAILSQFSDKDIADLVTAIKSKEYGPIRTWVVSHDMDATAFYRMLFDHLPNKIEPECLPTMVCLIADYNYKAAFAADKQLNALACLVELQSEGRFK